MKIMKEIEFSEMVEVNISSDDVIDALNELDSANSLYAYKNILNTCFSLVAKIPDEAIKLLDDAVRKNIVRHLEEQISRYKEKP